MWVRGRGGGMHASLHLSLFALYECPYSPFLYGLWVKGGGGSRDIHTRGGGGRAPICSVVYLLPAGRRYTFPWMHLGQGADGWYTVKSAFMQDQYWSCMKAGGGGGAKENILYIPSLTLPPHPHSGALCGWDFGYEPKEGP
uniref:Uncharacterized protein n=1 Tax=Morchella importuna TaxID=1174673 RepID=A0A650AFJ1_9PEZI|nr:hypothetical protein [Morchella importuna]QGN66684.1 hypothetical protein [Morchella importuna]